MKPAIRRDLGAVLVASTREHDWDEPPAAVAERWPLAIGAGELLRLACLHGVEACVSLSIRGLAETSGNERALMHEAYFAAVQGHLRARQDLAIAAPALDAAGIPWAAFKGPVLSELVYRRSDLRSYSDIDLLVSPGALQGAVAALERAGGELLDSNWVLARQRRNGELHVRLPGGTIADLHWALLNDPADRATFTIRTDPVLGRSREFVLDGVRVRTLAPEDTVVHLALHACTSGGTRLLWCKDLEQAAGMVCGDWQGVVTRASEWHAGLATAVMLIVAQRALGFDVETEVLRALAPGPTWARLARAVATISPVECWQGGGSLTRDVCRTTRADERASWKALGRRGVSLVKRRSRGGPHRADRDPSSPGSLVYPDGGARERANYFRDVQGTTDA